MTPPRGAGPLASNPGPGTASKLSPDPARSSVRVLKILPWVLGWPRGGLRAPPRPLLRVDGSMSHSLWQTHGMPILAINAGSSSIRFALFDLRRSARPRTRRQDRSRHRPCRCRALRDRARRGRDADARRERRQFPVGRRWFVEMAAIPGLARRGRFRRPSRGSRDVAHGAATGDGASCSRN